MVVACALASDAEFIVTGNQRDFPAEYRGIRVVPPRKFVVILAAALP